MELGWLTTLLIFFHSFVVMEKECKKHGLTEFSGKENRCKRCRIEAVQRNRKKLKQKAVDYKGGMCEKCGYNKSLSALQFHHINPEEKDFGISTTGNTRAWSYIKKELDKCILVCANCHAELHEEKQQENKALR
jgi:hypothetical protein